MLKRLFDVVLASISLAIFSPVLLVLAVLIKITSPGPVFYRGVRTGRNGKPFRIFKFRSMVVNADKNGASSTAGHDPRVTTVGKFIRKCKFDELSQVINVLVGDMSFVGPRPEVQKFTDLYNEEEKIILTLRPGITDWASIWNSDEATVLDGAPDADEAYAQLIRPTKLRLQILYAKHHSLFTDMKIIVYTILKLLRRGWIPAELRSIGPPMTWKEQQARQRSLAGRAAA
jgi:lipopolysaccharide/colanic/teichoic acid biosynthesis glycosyltransferase